MIEALGEEGVPIRLSSPTIQRSPLTADEGGVRISVHNGDIVDVNGAEEEEEEVCRSQRSQELIRLVASENRSAHELYLNTSHSQSNASLEGRALSFGNLSILSQSSAASDAPLCHLDGLSLCEEGEAARLSDDAVDYSQLDRYGFIVVPQQAGGPPRRAADGGGGGGLLQRTSLALRRGVGSCRSVEEDDPALRREEEKRGRLEASRAIKWVDMLQVVEEGRHGEGQRARGEAAVALSRGDWCRGHKRFESRLVKGIPECLRTKVWAIFLHGGSLDGWHGGALKASSPARRGGAVEAPPPAGHGRHGSTASGKSCTGGNSSSSLSSSSQSLAVTPARYRELYLKISGFERQIDLDIERTLRDHILFKARFSSAQVALFKILVAYSNLDQEVGYCQGMSTIAAFILLYFEEEAAFAIFQRIMERDGVRTFFTAGFPMLFETFHVQETLMERYMPKLVARLESFHITTSVYATKWYLTLFLGFPFSLATRIWDLFLFWGIDMLVCVALALLRMHEARLLALDYEPCMQFLSKLPDLPIDETRLIEMAWGIWRRINPHYRDNCSEGGSAGGLAEGSDQGSSRALLPSSTKMASLTGRGAREDRTSPFGALRLQYGKSRADRDPSERHPRRAASAASGARTGARAATMIISSCTKDK